MTPSPAAHMTPPAKKKVRRDPAQYEAQRARKKARDTRLLARFTHLYEEKRRRLDDCYGILAEEFFLSQRTVERLIARLLKES